MDPYYEAKDEVEQAIQKVRGMHDQWKRLLHTENTAKSIHFQELHSGIAGELTQLDGDLTDITETIRMVEENRARFPFDDKEVESRKAFVRAIQGSLRGIQDSITGRQALAKIESDKRLALGIGSGAEHAALRAARDERQALVARENRDFLDNQHQTQTQIIHQQNNDLTLLSQSVQRLGETARTMNTELLDHAEMLKSLEDGIDRGQERLNFVTKRMDRLLHTSDNKQRCLMIGLFVLSVVLLFLVINV